jgi:hypothetical protein
MIALKEPERARLRNAFELAGVEFTNGGSARRKDEGAGWRRRRGRAGIPGQEAEEGLMSGSLVFALATIVITMGLVRIMTRIGG